MIYGTGGYGSSTPGGGPFLVESSPYLGETGVAQNATVSFVVDSSAGVDPLLLNVSLDGAQAILGGVFLPGFAGTIDTDGTALNVAITSHPMFSGVFVGVAVEATDYASVSNMIGFSFLSVIPSVTGLRADTWCDGKRIDLQWTTPEDATRIRLVRSMFAFLTDPSDPGDILYEGAPTSSYSDTGLEEGQLYYYTLFITYSGAAPYRWFSDLACQVSGLSIKDYYTLEGDYVYNLLPRGIRRRDADPSRGGDRYRTRELCRMLQCGINLYRGWAEALVNLRDTDAMALGRLGEADNQLGLIASHVAMLGIPPERSFDAAVLRRIASGAVSAFKLKGNTTGLVLFAKLFTGWDATIVELGEPSCGVNRVFRLYDGKSRILSYADEAGTLTPGSVAINDSGLSAPNGGAVVLPSTSTGETLSFVLDAMGTHACVDELEILGGGVNRITFSDPSALLRAEFTGTITTPDPMVPNVKHFALSTGSYPWQFPYPDNQPPSWGVNAFAGHKLLTSDNNSHPVVTSRMLTAGTMEFVFDGGDYPTIDGDCALAYDYLTAATFEDRRPVLAMTLYIGEFSLLYDPRWDARLLDDWTLPGPWSLLLGFGSFTEFGRAPTLDDLVFLVPDVAAALGRSSTVSSLVMTDSSATWYENQWAGCYLNPNQDQEKLFRILGNTPTQLLVQGTDLGGLDVVSRAGSKYAILSENDAVKYQRLLAQIVRFAPTESRVFVEFT